MKSISYGQLCCVIFSCCCLLINGVKTIVVQKKCNPFNPSSWSRPRVHLLVDQLVEQIVQYADSNQVILTRSVQLEKFPLKLLCFPQNRQRIEKACIFQTSLQPFIYKFGDFHMSLHAIHSGQTISTVLAQVDHGSQLDILIWDETSKTAHTQT